MSGICSHHQGHDPKCDLCTRIPLTDDQRHYYEGWQESLAALDRNGWCVVERIVVDAYEELEQAARELPTSILEGRLGRALDALDKMRLLNRGFGKDKA